MPTRLYRCNDLKLRQIAEDIGATLKQDLPFLESVGITLSVVDTLLAKNAAFSQLQHDSNAKAVWKRSVSHRNTIKQNLILMIQEVKLAVTDLLIDEPFTLSAFPFLKLWKVNNQVYAARVQTIIELCANHAVGLTERGITPLFLSEMSATLAEFVQLTAATPQKRINRKEATAKRVAAGNEIYRMVKYLTQRAVMAHQKAGTTGMYVYISEFGKTQKSSERRRKKEHSEGKGAEAGK